MINLSIGKHAKEIRRLSAQQHILKNSGILSRMAYILKQVPVLGSVIKLLSKCISLLCLLNINKQLSPSRPLCLSSPKELLNDLQSVFAISCATPSVCIENVKNKQETVSQAICSTGNKIASLLYSKNMPLQAKKVELSIQDFEMAEKNHRSTCIQDLFDICSSIVNSSSFDKTTTESILQMVSDLGHLHVILHELEILASIPNRMHENQASANYYNSLPDYVDPKFVSIDQLDSSKSVFLALQHIGRKHEIKQRRSLYQQEFCMLEQELKTRCCTILAEVMPLDEDSKSIKTTLLENTRTIKQLFNEQSTNISLEQCYMKLFEFAYENKNKQQADSMRNLLINLIMFTGHKTNIPLETKNIHILEQSIMSSWKQWLTSMSNMLNAEMKSISDQSKPLGQQLLFSDIVESEPMSEHEKTTDFVHMRLRHVLNFKIDSIIFSEVFSSLISHARHNSSLGSLLEPIPSIPLMIM